MRWSVVGRRVMVAVDGSAKVEEGDGRNEAKRVGAGLTTERRRMAPATQGGERLGWEGSDGWPGAGWWNGGDGARGQGR